MSFTCCSNEYPLVRQAQKVYIVREFHYYDEWDKIHAVFSTEAQALVFLSLYSGAENCEVVEMEVVHEAQ